MNIYFSDYFSVSKKKLKKYGAFDISLINDLPLFIDPFLLFNSNKKQYKKLHKEIIKYVTFLRKMSSNGEISKGLIDHWFLFPEVKQNWFGYSKIGNGGSGLGPKFATALNKNLETIFSDFGDEQITRGSHLEKLCLVQEGVGKDNISDFSTNLIKGFLCKYTEKFAIKNIHNSRLKNVFVDHSEFNYKIRRWNSKKYCLPYIDGDYVLLTPKELLTKDEAWINKYDIIGDFDEIVESLPNSVLRAQINDYLLRRIPQDANQAETNEAIINSLNNFPILIDYYIKHKEDNGEKAVAVSDLKVKETETLLINGVRDLVSKLQQDQRFYKCKGDTFEEAWERVMFLKAMIENNDGYKIFYVKGKPIKRESDLQLMFRLTWFASQDDVNSEVNNGRGPVDYKISRGSKDSTLVEFKLASNSKLKQNLENQVEIYKKANRTNKSIKVILYFSDAELDRVAKIMKLLGLKESKELVLIDADATNKPSASKAKYS